MSHFRPVTDPADPALDPYRNQRDAWLRAPHNPINHTPNHAATSPPPLFLAEGELVVRQLLASPHPVHSVLATPARAASLADALAALPPTTPVHLAEPAILESVLGFDLHRGVLAAGLRPPPTPWRTLATDPSVRTLLILEDLSNHDNVGSLFRSAAALAGPDACAVLLSPRCCDPLYRKALRVSIGWACRVRFAELSPWPAALAELAQPAGGSWSTLALTPAADAVPLSFLTNNKPARPALVIGAEGPGLSPAALAACSARVRIPIHPAVDSLNAAVAGAIALAALAPANRAFPRD